MKELLKMAGMYVGFVLACWIRGPLERLEGPHQIGPTLLKTAAGPNQFAGRTALASGTAFATVSTQMVNSDSIIGFAFQVSSTGAMNVNSGAYFAVSSLRSGISFALGYVDGAGRGPGGTFMWEIRRSS